MTGLSIVRGATDIPLLEITIGQALRHAASRWRDGLALVSRHQSIRWTWGEFDAEVAD
jgi:fatty-acyl-CoA synthase